jgi:hypothetical protein
VLRGANRLDLDVSTAMADFAVLSPWPEAADRCESDDCDPYGAGLGGPAVMCIGRRTTGRESCQAAANKRFLRASRLTK